jgi:hypothetical protein
MHKNLFLCKMFVFRDECVCMCVYALVLYVLETIMLHKNIIILIILLFAVTFRKFYNQHTTVWFYGEKMKHHIFPQKGNFKLHFKTILLGL